MESEMDPMVVLSFDEWLMVMEIIRDNKDRYSSEYADAFTGIANSIEDQTSEQ
jgi:hypothetical protein